MYKKYIFPIFLLCFSLSSLAAQGIEFETGSWSEILDKAKAEKKLIFMDAYAVWCGPCKKMARDVFAHPEVGAFFNRHFINAKIDMEKGEGPKLARTYKVKAYPTLLFIDAEGEVVNASAGALGPAAFIELAKASLQVTDKSPEFEKSYEEGEREPQFLRNYAYSLLDAGRDNQKIANEYLRSQEGQLDSKENLEFLFDFTIQADSRIFDLLLEHKEAIIKEQGEEKFQSLVRRACDYTVKKAVQYNSPDLLNEAKNKMKTANKAFAKEYSSLADILYAQVAEDLQAWITSVDKYLKGFAKKEAKSWFSYAGILNSRYASNEEANKQAELWAAKAYKLEPENKEYLRLYALLLQRNGKEKQAQELQKKLD